jgi:multidrug resistance protein, MATE family
MLDLKYSTLLKVAVPLMVSTFVQSIVMITNAAFMSRYDTLSFDAVGNAGLLYVTVFMTLSGMGDGAQIVIARRIGQDRQNAVGKLFASSMFINFLLACCLFYIIQAWIPNMLFSYSKHIDLANEQVKFISLRSFALFFAMITLSIQAFFFAIGKTWVVLISGLITAISNIFLDYGLIFGNGPFPELGIEGAAIASTIADGLGMLFLLTFLFFSKEKTDYALFTNFRISWNALKELIRIGSPSMFQGFTALATWTVFFTWIEQIGKFELTVSQNIRAIYFLAFVPIWGFSATTKTYISQYIGKGDFKRLPFIQKRIQVLTMLFLFIFFHGALLYPEKLIGWINPDETYIQESASILRYIAFSIFLFGFISVYFQTINGSGNTQVTFMIELACVVTYLVAAYLLIKVFEQSIFWIWSVEYVYFGTMGILSILYLKFFDWKKKRV